MNEQKIVQTDAGPEAATEIADEGATNTPTAAEPAEVATTPERREDRVNTTRAAKGFYHRALRPKLEKKKIKPGLFWAWVEQNIQLDGADENGNPALTESGLDKAWFSFRTATSKRAQFLKNLRVDIFTHVQCVMDEVYFVPEAWQVGQNDKTVGNFAMRNPKTGGNGPAPVCGPCQIELRKKERESGAKWPTNFYTHSDCLQKIEEAKERAKQRDDRNRKRTESVNEAIGGKPKSAKPPRQEKPKTAAPPAAPQTEAPAEPTDRAGLKAKFIAKFGADKVSDL